MRGSANCSAGYRAQRGPCWRTARSGWGCSTNRTPAGERARLHAGLVDGTVDILVGTHALLTEGALPPSAGRHRRAAPFRRGAASGPPRKRPGRVVPDVLVMTATPIPRTAAMTVYGDLDTTVLDELPPGRTPSRPLGPGPARGGSGLGRVRTEVERRPSGLRGMPAHRGVRADPGPLRREERERLAGVSSGLRLGLLHGQLPATEKEA